MASDRRTLLADAALDVLADEGMRGLTHRAVDRKAAMPPGTTSAYFRTRAALLTGLVAHLVRLDQAELHATADKLPPLRTVEELVDGMVTLTRQRLTGEGRRRSLARHACAIESVRDKELREILVPRENAGREAVRLFLAEQGVTDAENRTHTLLTCVDGLVFDRLVNGGDVQREALEGLVAAALRGLHVATSPGVMTTRGRPAPASAAACCDPSGGGDDRLPRWLKRSGKSGCDPSGGDDDQSAPSSSAVPMSGLRPLRG